MDVPTYPEPLFITGAAVNIFPDLEAKHDIVQGFRRPPDCLASAPMRQILRNEEGRISGSS
jgi:hypothetical protein